MLDTTSEDTSDSESEDTSETESANTQDTDGVTDEIEEANPALIKCLTAMILPMRL